MGRISTSRDSKHSQAVKNERGAVGENCKNALQARFYPEHHSGLRSAFGLATRQTLLTVAFGERRSILTPKIPSKRGTKVPLFDGGWRELN
jgi:hypothetical protein